MPPGSRAATSRPWVHTPYTAGGRLRASHPFLWLRSAGAITSKSGGSCRRPAPGIWGSGAAGGWSGAIDVCLLSLHTMDGSSALPETKLELLESERSSHSPARPRGLLAQPARRCSREALPWPKLQPPPRRRCWCLPLEGRQHLLLMLPPAARHVAAPVQLACTYLLPHRNSMLRWQRVRYQRALGSCVNMILSQCPRRMRQPVLLKLAALQPRNELHKNTAVMPCSILCDRDVSTRAT